MAATLDELTVSWTEDGVETVKEIDKTIVHEGSGWATIAFVAEEHDKETEEVAARRILLRRYRKRRGQWQVHSKFTLSLEQAASLSKVLSGWAPD